MNYLRKVLSLNSSRERLWMENQAFARLVPAGAKVLDAGAGSSPYRALFEHAQYESADFQGVEGKSYVPATYVCDLASIPVEDNRFDFVIFNQVMEHLPDPALVLKELYRVLRSGGKMIYTGPLYYEEHEVPYDFYRYTQFGLRHLFEQSGFFIDRLEWLEGYFGTIGYQTAGIALQLPYRPKSLGGGLWGYMLSPFMLSVKAVALGLSVVFHRLEMRIKYQDSGYPKNYIALLSRS